MRVRYKTSPLFRSGGGFFELDDNAANTEHSPTLYGHESFRIKISCRELCLTRSFKVGREATIIANDASEAARGKSLSLEDYEMDRESVQPDVCRANFDALASNATDHPADNIECDNKDTGGVPAAGPMWQTSLTAKGHILDDGHGKPHLSVLGSRHESDTLAVVIHDGGKCEDVSFYGGLPVDILGSSVMGGFQLYLSLPSTKYEELVADLQPSIELHIELDAGAFPNCLVEWSPGINMDRTVKFLFDVTKVENNDEIPEGFFERNFYEEKIPALQPSPFPVTLSLVRHSSDDDPLDNKIEEVSEPDVSTPEQDVYEQLVPILPTAEHFRGLISAIRGISTGVVIGAVLIAIAILATIFF